MPRIPITVTNANPAPSNWKILTADSLLNGMNTNYSDENITMGTFRLLR